MRRLTLYLSLIALMLITVLSACQKQLELVETNTPPQEPEPEVPTTDSPYPSKIVFTVLPEEYIETRTIDYDTLNNVIRVYRDDPATPQPFDLLINTYILNDDGYLIEYRELDFWDEVETYVTKIERYSDNRIRYMTNLDEFFEQPDTLFFQYGQLEHDPTVTAWHNTINGDGTPAFVRMQYFHKSNGQLEKLAYPIWDESIEYMYNQNRFIGYSYTRDDLNIKVEVGYGNQQPSGEKDHLLELILGKDYYLQPIRDLYFMNIFSDNLRMSISGTDPNRPTFIKSQVEFDGDILVETRTIDYQYYPDGRLRRTRTNFEELSEMLEFYY